MSALKISIKLGPEARVGNIDIGRSLCLSKKGSISGGATVLR